MTKDEAPASPKDAALKQALTDYMAAFGQALEAHDIPYSQQQQEADDKAREALAQPVQEPVAWMVYTQDGQSVYVTDNSTDIQESQRALPLYTTPPAAQPEEPAQEPVAWRRREVGGVWQYFGWEEAGMNHQFVERWNKNGFECEAIPRFAEEKNT